MLLKALSQFAWRVLDLLSHLVWLGLVTYVLWAAGLLLVGAEEWLFALLWPLAGLIGIFLFPAFLLPLVLLSMWAAWSAWRAIKRRVQGDHWWLPIGPNLAFALCFFGVGELYGAVLIHGQACRIEPDAFHAHAFIRSVLRFSESAPAHAELRKDGVDYIWSYAELRFVPLIPDKGEHQ